VAYLKYDQLLSTLGSLLQGTSQEELFATFGNVAATAGGTAFALVTPSPESAATRLPGMIGWCDYQDFGADVERQSARPLFWHHARVDGAHAVGQFLLGDAQGLAGIDGLLAPVPKPDGPGAAFLIKLDTSRLSGETAHWLSVLCVALQWRLQELSAPRDLPDGITQREREVLRWLAEGKSAEDAGSILGISAATVMFHYRNVAARYGTLNRTHTVVEAMRRGELPLAGTGGHG
jgi:DNA-binding CsgD family transcriptional regulator